MIEVKELSVSYTGDKTNTRVLNNINLRLNKGEIVAIIGPSGCGKSTLINCMSGILGSYEGTITIDEESLNPKQHSIGLIPQNYGLLSWKNVYDNATLSLKIKKKNNISQEYKVFIDNILESLSLKPLLKRFPNELSGGQKQRVSIARAFIMKPDLLLMDEPFSALDALTREDTQELFLHLWKSYRPTTIFITHSIEEAVYLGGKIIILSASPSSIVKIIDNPSLGMRNYKDKDEYLDTTSLIRKIIKEGWK